MMGDVEDTARQLEKNPNNIGFKDLCDICDKYFGKARIKSSHHIYKMPWPGDPRIYIQNDNGKAKAYQVRQVAKALRKLAGS